MNSSGSRNTLPFNYTGHPALALPWQVVSWSPGQHAAGWPLLRRPAPHEGGLRLPAVNRLGQDHRRPILIGLIPGEGSIRSLPLLLAVRPSSITSSLPVM